jgi:hypothetical protein
MTLYLLSTDPDVALTFNGKKWSAPDTIDAGTIEPLDAISCPSATFCTAVDGWGQAFDPDVQKGYGLTGISCRTPRLCLAVDWEGNELTGRG